MPDPSTVVTLLSGLHGHQPAGIVAWSLGVFIMAAHLWTSGAPIRDFVERRRGLMFALFVVILSGSFCAVRFL